jgi:hypothetical protein
LSDECEPKNDPTDVVFVKSISGKMLTSEEQLILTTSMIMKFEINFVTTTSINTLGMLVVATIPVGIQVQ